MLDPYMDTLLASLCACLENSAQEVQEAALSAVAFVAQAVETDFSRFYGNFMPGVMNILTNCSAPQQ